MVLEGIPYFISPRGVRAYLRLLERSGDRTLRLLGFAMMILGLTLAYVSTR